MDDQNPYEAPHVVASDDSRQVRGSLDSLREVIVVLIIALGIQWACHSLTAVVMFNYIDKADGGPTSEILDSVFYGFCCVAFTALIALGGGYLGMSSLTWSRERPNVSGKN